MPCVVLSAISVFKMKMKEYFKIGNILLEIYAEGWGAARRRRGVHQSVQYLQMFLSCLRNKSVAVCNRQDPWSHECGIALVALLHLIDHNHDQLNVIDTFWSIMSSSLMYVISCVHLTGWWEVIHLVWQNLYTGHYAQSIQLNSCIPALNVSAIDSYCFILTLTMAGDHNVSICQILLASCSCTCSTDQNEIWHGDGECRLTIPIALLSDI